MRKLTKSSFPFRQFHPLLRALKIRPRDHEFAYASLDRPFHNFLQIIFMRPFAVINTTKDRIPEVDSYLE